jgi:hypothetical protein
MERGLEMKEGRKGGDSEVEFFLSISLISRTLLNPFYSLSSVYRTLIMGNFLFSDYFFNFTYSLPISFLFAPLRSFLRGESVRVL